jgi:PAS domain-containing protein
MSDTTDLADRQITAYQKPDLDAFLTHYAKTQRLAVHRTIVVVDVEGFGGQHRTNPHQVAVRDGLYGAMRDAFGRAGVPWDDCGAEDRGDGVFVLIPPEVPKALLAEALPPALVTALQAHNGAHPGPEQIRLRMALHAGEVHYDEHGVTAAAVNLAFRLLEAGALKAALASSPGVLAVIASSWFFEEVVRHATSAAGYHPVEVTVKETTATGWICLPDQVDSAGQVMLQRLSAEARYRAASRRWRCARCRATRPLSPGVSASWTG